MYMYEEEFDYNPESLNVLTPVAVSINHMYIYIAKKPMKITVVLK